MTDPDPLQSPLFQVLQAVFANLIDRGDVDVVAMPGINEIEVQADAWTLVLAGWPLASAWIALDETPSSHAEHMAALAAAIAPPERDALREADRQLDGAVIAALAGSSDPLSEALALLLVGAGQRDDAPR